MSDLLHRYDGAAGVVTWDAARCLHAAVCVRALPAAFAPGRRPWVVPDAAAPDAVARTVACCPTGALHAYAPDGTLAEAVPAEATVTAVADGPLYVHAQTAVVRPDGTEVVRDTRLALCRCGRSQRKPFCDGSHADEPAPFVHSGALPPGDATAEAAGVEITITVQPSGPLTVAGPVRVVGADGASVVKAKVGLCRCGGSARMPFCDGSHRTNGFAAE